MSRAFLKQQESLRLQSSGWSSGRVMILLVCFQGVTSAGIWYEATHFARMGYHLTSIYRYGVPATLLALTIGLAAAKTPSWKWILVAALMCYCGDMLLAIHEFPLNYLRSDMLPVILWADTNLLHHASPYTTMFVGGRVYDFPYLPGMIVAYLPAVFLHLDLRFMSGACVVASAILIVLATKDKYKIESATLVALFLTCPYLQYRHELYNQPHWLSLVIAFVLMQRRRFLLAALTWGVSMALYQFSWILLPFFLLNGFRRRGWTEVSKLLVASMAGAMVIVGPFLSSASRRIASNTVGQWGLRQHADADPINLSYWITYMIHPDKLLRLQAVMLVGIFLFCLWKRRCTTLADTVRWMVASLTLFILLNVLVDGYFYLMLLVPMLVYVCVDNGWWKDYPEPT